MRIVMALIGLTLLHAGAARAEKFVVSTGPFLIQCTSAGQVCDPPQTLAVGDPTRTLKVRKFVYESPGQHCSTGRILIELDGRQVAKMKNVARLETTTKRLRKALRLRPGPHTFAFRFEGKVGGCNTGAVSGWGGTITVFGRR